MTTLSCVKGAGYLVSISGGQAGADAPCHMTLIPLHRFPMTKYEPRSGFVYLGNVFVGTGGVDLVADSGWLACYEIRRVVLRVNPVNTMSYINHLITENPSSEISRPAESSGNDLNGRWGQMEIPCIGKQVSI